MRKYLLSLLLILALLSVSVHAETMEVKVKVNNVDVVSPVPAQIVNDRTMLPMRSIFERIGAKVTWMESEKIIFATKGSFLITMQIDNNIMSVQQVENDEIIKIVLETPPFIINGSTLVPVRAVAESLGCSVKWDPQTYTVDISTISNGGEGI